MRVLYDNVNFSSASGPNAFASKLAKELHKLGCEPADLDNHDVAIAFIKRFKSVKNKPTVQRLDGLWPDSVTTGGRVENQQIRELYDSCEHVVFQSKFDKRLVERAFGPRENTSVIMNGTDNKPVKPLSTSLLEIRNKYDKLYVCSAVWRVQKRLAANVALFKHLKRRQPNSSLIVLGPVPPAEKHLLATPGVWNGTFEPEVCKQIYSMCDWMFHLSWLDHCPNVVVDAVSVRTPVVCSAHGGTREIVGDYGVVLRESHEYDFSLVNTDSPPDIDVEQFDELPERYELPNPPSLDIRNTAQEYMRVFESL